MTSRTSTLGILLRHAGSNRASSLLLALLVCIAVLVVAIAPRALVVLADSELAAQLEDLSTLQADVTASGTTGTATAQQLFGGTGTTIANYPATLDKPFGDLLGEPEWFASFTPDRVVPREPVTAVETSFTLGFDLAWLERVRIVAGEAPAQWTDTLYRDVPANELEPMEIALSTDVAATTGLSVGDVVDGDTLPYRISGIFEAIDPDDPYWQHAEDFLTASSTLTLSGITLATANVYADPDSAEGMGAIFQNLRVSAWFPNTSASFAYDQIPLVIDQAHQASSLGLSLGGGPTLAVQTYLPVALQKVQAKVTALTALLALAASAPLGMVMAVVVLGIRTVIERRRAAIRLASARGLSEMRVRGAMALEGLAIALPASVIATIVAALAIPGPLDLAPPLIITLLVALAFAALTSPSALREDRSDVSASPRTRTRVISEAVIIGLTALAVFLLFRRGLLAASASVGVDPLLASAPLLLALTVCVVVLRVYPFPLLWLQKRMRRRRGPIGLLGAARAVRDPALGFASVLAIIIGVSAAVFSLVMVTTVTSGLDAAAHQSVGGDLRLEADSLTARNLADVRAVTGVREATPVQVIQGADLTRSGRPSGVTILLADTASLHASNPELPVLADESGSSIPILISSDIYNDRPGDLTLNEQDARAVGPVDVDSLPVASTAWVMVDSSFAERVSGKKFEPEALYITLSAGADSPGVVQALQRIVPDAELLASTTLVAEASARPSITGMTTTLLAGTIVSLLLGILTVVLSAVAAASSRARAVGVMRLLGMPMQRARALVAWELAPVTITAVLAGTALGLALPWLVTALVDLRDFVGGSVVVEPSVPATLVTAATVGFALVVLAVGAIASASGFRTTLATTARMGAE